MRSEVLGNCHPEARCAHPRPHSLSLFSPPAFGLSLRLEPCSGRTASRSGLVRRSPSTPASARLARQSSTDQGLTAGRASRRLGRCGNLRSARRDRVEPARSQSPRRDLTQRHGCNPQDRVADVSRKLPPPPPHRRIGDNFLGGLRQGLLRLGRRPVAVKPSRAPMPRTARNGGRDAVPVGRIRHKCETAP